MRLSPRINLGADRTRMRDARDVQRQTYTSQVVLDRFFHDDPDRRFELQVVADEVGMGKTFVALAVAYSILEAARAGHDDLRGTYGRILVLTPANDALFEKWTREVTEFVKRCVSEGGESNGSVRFRPKAVKRLDDLVATLRSPQGAEVVIAKTSCLGGRVQDFDTKARIVLATVFRVWGNSFRIEHRERMLKGAKAWGWPQNPRELAYVHESEAERLSIPQSDIEDAVERILCKPSADDLKRLADLERRCLEASTPHVRGREEMLVEIRKKLIEIYKVAVASLIKRAFPLVIVDEAHNWKNGPSSGTNNYNEFRDWIAPRSRRALLLTATPFQLRPDEMSEILQVSDHLAIPEDRRARLRAKRESDIRSVLRESEEASKRFAHAWAQLPDRVGTPEIDAAWRLDAVQSAVRNLAEIADRPGALRGGEIDAEVDRGLRQVEPRLRVFLKEALRLYASNRDLSQELGDLVIRHRRHTEHRLARIGHEFDVPAAEVAGRPDRQILHAAPGMDVSGDSELPHYLLMRATSELEGGRRKAALGSSMTGCYSTLFASAESRQFERAAKGTSAGVYVDLLRELVGSEAADATHPKMQAVVHNTLVRWERGEKTLIFAFRNNTANRLAELLRAGTEERIKHRKQLCMGSESGLTTLRQRLTSRDRDLIPLVLDRVLWSVMWAPPGGERRPFGPENLLPQRADYEAVARLALSFGVDLLGKLVDRVFLQRAVECAIARRLRTEAPARSRFRLLLDRMADSDWVGSPYGGLEATGEDADVDAVIDERGVHSVYEKLADNPQGVAAYAQQLFDRDAAARKTGQRSIIRTAFDGPSLWLGVDPMELALERWHLPADVEADLRDERLFHVQLTALTWPGSEPDWRTRAIALQAVRRAALREAMLARLLPSEQELAEEGWGHMLVERFKAPLSEGGESMLRRLGVFLEDVAGAGGSVDDPATPRGAYIDATRSRGESGVSLVDGSTKPESRVRTFIGFNTPLLPEILICTAVGQEGIDLHRHCRNVVHYDLAWNPATLEQRTGRVDRIGCAALRERKLSEQAESASRSFLEVSVPYLAGTYDERMFEELRLRAQTFEVLTGGDLAPDHVDGHAEDGKEDDEGQEAGTGLVTLPKEMVEELRVNLAVWRGKTADPSKPG